MEYRESELDGILVLELIGNLDMLNAGILKERIQEFTAAGGRKVLLDLDQVGFVDSSGFGLMMSINDKLNNTGGCLTISRVPKTVQQIFKIAKIASIIKSFLNMEDAIAHLKKL